MLNDAWPQIAPGRRNLEHEEGNIAPTGKMRDVAVVGTGPSGLVAALALAHVGADTVVIGPAPAPSRDGPIETRTAALLTSSVDLLEDA